MAEYTFKRIFEEYVCGRPVYILSEIVGSSNKEKTLFFPSVLKLSLFGFLYVKIPV